MSRSLNFAKKIARTAGLGQALLYGYHRPIGLTRNLILDGGPLERRRTARGRAEMIAATDRLAPLKPPPGPLLSELKFLTGQNFWFQTVFCFVSLQRFTERRLDPVLYDDGTLTPELRTRILRVIPWARFVARAEAEAAMDRILPPARTPRLRARRAVYPHLRKLTDLHLDAAGRSVVMDSDMLFFRKPERLFDLLTQPDRSFHLVEAEEAYGYSEDLLQSLDSAPLPRKVNVGLYALHSPSIDWDEMERHITTLEDREGGHYLQEQALTALCLGRQDPVALPMKDYLVLPSLAEGRDPQAVMHHYVAHSKRSYFQHGWRRVAGTLTEGNAP